jgi:hypothetical protein
VQLLLWDILKDEVCGNNPDTEDYLNQSIKDVASSVSPTELNLQVVCICKLKETTSSAIFKYVK